MLKISETCCCVINIVREAMNSDTLHDIIKYIIPIFSEVLNSDDY
jgi:hypothetical protein